MKRDHLPEFTTEEEMYRTYTLATTEHSILGYLFPDLMYVFGSMICVYLFLSGGDVAIGFVGYGLIAVRFLYFLYGLSTSAKVYRSLLQKYERHLEFLHSQSLRAREDGTASTKPVESTG